MKLTYKDSATFINDVKLRFLVFTITLGAKGEKVTIGWVSLLFMSAVVNGLILWPLALIWAANQFGVHVTYTFETFAAGYLFYYVLTKKD